MRKLLLTLAIILISTSSYAADAPRGRQQEYCGFDINNDGVRGDTSGANEGPDCDICDGVTAAPSGQNLIYVDCGASTNGNGNPGTPKNSITNAMAVAIDGSIICFKGTCTDVNNTVITHGGNAVTTQTRTKTGNEPEDQQYPAQPFMVVGWDADNDGKYPPDDTDDVSVLDGTGKTGAFNLSVNGVSNIEFAHYTTKNYLGTSGQLHITNSGGSDHIYFHNIRGIDINKNNNTGFTWANMYGPDIDYFVWRNSTCENCGGDYFWRGGQSPDPALASEHWLFENNSITNYNAVGGNGGSIDDFWGANRYVAYVDNYFDCQPNAWSPAGSAKCVGIEAFMNCSSDTWVINNEFIDYCTAAINGGPGASGDSQYARICGSVGWHPDNIVIDRNVIRMTHASLCSKAIRGINFTGNATDGTYCSGANQALCAYGLKGLKIINNYLYSDGKGYRSAILVDGSYDVEAGASCKDIDTGITRLIAHNTIVSANVDGTTEALLNIEADLGCSPKNYTVYDNIFASNSTTGVMIRVSPNSDATEATFGSDYNIFKTFKATWKLSGTTTVLATWGGASQSSGDAHSKIGSPYWDQTGNQTLPTLNGKLLSTDTIAKNAGGPVISAVPKDFYGTTRVAPDDSGYHKASSSSCTGDGNCNDTNPCTTDTCVSLVCSYSNNSASCNDGLFCTGTDTCSGGACGHTGDPCSGADADGDCKETCDETANNCLGNDPNGSLCADGVTCTGSPATPLDYCSNGVCLGGADNCDPGEICNVGLNACQSVGTTTTVPTNNQGPGESRGPVLLRNGGFEVFNPVSVNDLASINCESGRCIAITDDSVSPGDCDDTTGGTETALCCRDTHYASGWHHCNLGDLRFFADGSTVFDGRIVVPSQFFPDDDATPSVVSGNIFGTGDTSPVDMTNMDNGFEGQIVVVRFRDGNRTVKFSNANFNGHGEEDWTPGNKDVMFCAKSTSAWWCVTSDEGGGSSGPVVKSATGWLTYFAQSPELLEPPAGPWMPTQVCVDTTQIWASSGTCTAPKIQVGTTGDHTLLINSGCTLSATGECCKWFDSTDAGTGLGRYQSTAPSHLQAYVTACSGTISAGKSLVSIQYQDVDTEPSSPITFTNLSSCESAYLAVLNFEEAANANLTDSGGGSSADAFTDNNASIGRDTTNKLEGAKAATFDTTGTGASADFYHCPVGTCGDLNVAPTSAHDFTIACRVRPTTDGTYDLARRTKTSHGFLMRRNPTNDVIECTFGAGGGITATSATNADPINVYASVGCRWDSSQSLELQALINGQASGTAMDLASWDFNTSGQEDFKIGQDGNATPTGDFLGQMDECVFDDAAWTNDEWCQWHRCGSRRDICMGNADNSDYLTCSNNTDCQVSGSGNTTAICDTAAGKCQGRNVNTLCTGSGVPFSCCTGSGTGTCNCTPPAPSAACPS